MKLAQTKRPALGACALALVLAAAAAPALAHHSFAMFDFTKQKLIKGVVSEVHWLNPHVVIYVTADHAPGTPEEIWSAELTSPGNLIRGGWSKRAFNVGDKVEVTVNPLRNGGHGGAFMRGTVLATGKVWSSDLRAANGKPGI